MLVMVFGCSKGCLWFLDDVVWFVWCFVCVCGVFDVGGRWWIVGGSLVDSVYVFVVCGASVR